MLTIIVPETERYNEITNEFIYVKEQKLTLEHSLVSIRKWESKWHKPFLAKYQKSKVEENDYIRCMTLTQNVDPAIYECLTDQNWKDIYDYMNDEMTATTFKKQNGKSSGRGNSEILTAELIYYYMIQHNIPVEFQRWHINQLLILIQICNVKNGPEKKMGRNEILRNNAALNKARRQKMHTKG